MSVNATYLRLNQQLKIFLYKSFLIYNTSRQKKNPIRFRSKGEFFCIVYFKNPPQWRVSKLPLLRFLIGIVKWISLLERPLLILRISHYVHEALWKDHTAQLQE